MLYETTYAVYGSALEMLAAFKKVQIHLLDFDIIIIPKITILTLLCLLNCYQIEARKLVKIAISFKFKPY